MSDIHRRLKKAEEKLNLNQEQITVNIVCFSGRELPPDDTKGSMTLHYVAYEDVRKEKVNQ